MRPPRGTGPGEITDDGCAAELYARLPSMGEAEIVSAALAPGASVLDLGCGTGRVAHRLIELGHPVVAVDQSAAMLAHVRAAETVCAPIAGLDLGCRFGGVLLASHLVNIPDAGERHEILAGAARHVAPDGRLVAEWHAPAWFDAAAGGSTGTVGEVRVELRDVHVDGDLLTATVRYQTGAGLWTQTFTALRITHGQLVSKLAAVRLVFDGFLTDDHTWFAARPA